MSFDLDNLLGLLFFVVFIVLPLFSRGKKKSQPQQGKTAQGQAPRPPVAPGGQPTTAAPRAPLSGQPVASADRGASRTITLEEIALLGRERQDEERVTERGLGLGKSLRQRIGEKVCKSIAAAARFRDDGIAEEKGQNERPKRRGENIRRKDAEVKSERRRARAGRRGAFGALEDLDEALKAHALERIA